jgi:hypothetical protein
LSGIGASAQEDGNSGSDRFSDARAGQVDQLVGVDGDRVGEAEDAQFHLIAHVLQDETASCAADVLPVVLFQSNGNLVSAALKMAVI